MSALYNLLSIPSEELSGVINAYTLSDHTIKKYTPLGMFLYNTEQKNTGIQIVTKLIEAKADVNMRPYRFPTRQRSNDTNLGLALRNWPDVVPLLIEHGAIPTAHDLRTAISEQRHVSLLINCDMNRIFVDVIDRRIFNGFSDKDKLTIRQHWQTQLKSVISVFISKDPCGIIVSYSLL